MVEYIEREAVLKHLRECEGTPPEICYTYPIFKALECFVEDVPAADVAPVVHGRWKCEGMGDYSCSLCTEVVSGNDYNYCPNCGASMFLKERFSGDRM